MFKKEFHKDAYGLYAGQNSADQDKCINEYGQIFFSTTIAETSLTLPNLKIVIDSQKIRFDIYNYELDANQLVEKDCSISTSKQRMGRLGRTGNVGYYYSYKKIDDKRENQFPLSELEKIDFTDIVLNFLQMKMNRELIENIIMSISYNYNKSDFEKKLKKSF